MHSAQIAREPRQNSASEACWLTAVHCIDAAFTVCDLCCSPATLLGFEAAADQQMMCPDQREGAAAGGLPPGLEFVDAGRLLGSGKKPGEVIVVKEDAGAIAYSWDAYKCALSLAPHRLQLRWAAATQAGRHGTAWSSLSSARSVTLAFGMRTVSRLLQGRRCKGKQQVCPQNDGRRRRTCKHSKPSVHTALKAVISAGANGLHRRRRARGQRPAQSSSKDADPIMHSGWNGGSALRCRPPASYGNLTGSTPAGAAGIA